MLGALEEVDTVDSVTIGLPDADLPQRERELRLHAEREDRAHAFWA